MKIGGKEIPTWAVVGGGGVLVIGVWYVYKRGAGTSSSTGSSSTSGQIDPLTGLPTSEDNTIDPLTGMTYLEEAQQYGSVSAAEAAVSSGQGYYGSGAGSYGALDSGYPTISGLSSQPTGSSFSSNAAWAQAVTSGLVSLGYNSQDVATALGLFFAQQPLGSGSDGVSYASIVQAAEAEFGPPPQGTYNIIPVSTNSGSGQGGSSGSTAGTVTVPNVVGKNYEAASKAITAAGLVVSPASTNGQASGISGGGWVNPVTAQNPAAGTSTTDGSAVTITGSPTANPGGTNKSTGGSTGTSTGGSTVSAQVAWNGRPKSIAAVQALPKIVTGLDQKPNGAGLAPGWYQYTDTLYSAKGDGATQTVYVLSNGKEISGPTAAPANTIGAGGPKDTTMTFKDGDEQTFLAQYKLLSAGS